MWRMVICNIYLSFPDAPIFFFTLYSQGDALR